jgi:hypothetical protein
MILVRDSKNPLDPPLCYTWEEMDAFVDGVKKGEFDALLAAVKEFDLNSSVCQPSAKTPMMPDERVVSYQV